MDKTMSRLTQFIADLTDEPDSTLLASFLGGNQAAFRELVKRHGRLVFGVCKRILRHHQDAEDAFQAVFVVLAYRAANVRRQDALGSWLFGVATRVALKARARRTRLQACEQAAQDIDHACENNFHHDGTELIVWAIQQLPEIYRAAVLACDLEGLSRKEAARRLGWTEGTLSGRLSRARKLLEKRLREAGLILPATGLAAVLGTQSTIRAGASEAVIKFISTPASVPVAVAALTQGVVRSMFALKLKTVTAAILVVCTVGFCTWMVAAGDQSGSTPTTIHAVAPPAQPKSPGPDVEEQRTEINRLEEEARKAIQILEEEKKKLTSQGVQGEIVRRLQDGIVEINLGSAFPVKVGEAFAILPGDFPEKGLKARMRTIRVPDGKGEFKPVERLIDKGSIELVEVLGPKHSRCRITSETEPIRDAIAAGDLLLPPEEVKKIGTTPPENVKRRIQQIDDKLAVARRVLADARYQEKPSPVAPTEEERQKAAREREGIADEHDELVRLLRAVVDAEKAERKALADFTVAQANLNLAKAKLAKAEKEVESWKSSPSSAKVVTIHVRPLLSEEKSFTLEAGRVQTVLEGLAYAARETPIKLDETTVWVARVKELLPVDLAAITQKSDNKTNYKLQPGDQLFVQINVKK